MSKYREWVADVTHWPKFVAFCPYERKTGMIITGLNFITDRAPGKCVGVIHGGGQEAAEAFVGANPDCKKRFSARRKVRA